MPWVRRLGAPWADAAMTSPAHADGVSSLRAREGGLRERTKMLLARDPRLDSKLDSALARESPAFLPALVPNRWHGQVDCRVGPFPSRAIAEHFAGRVVDFGDFEAYSGRLFPRRDGWFVEVLPGPASG